jgi:hypothetical protein
MVVELEHLKTKTRLIYEKFVSVRGECETSYDRHLIIEEKVARR